MGLTILGIAGSLRAKSFNRGALRAAQEVAPTGTKLDIFPLDDIPIFSQDREEPMPPPVVEFKRRIRAADAILIATPEYNYSMPGVLKNAIDWASRPYGDSAWEGKPVALMGASPGMLGTARAQYHLRQVFMALNSHLLNRPELLIANADEHFDENGNLTDPEIRKRIGRLVEALVQWTEKLRKPA